MMWDEALKCPHLNPLPEGEPDGSAGKTATGGKTGNDGGKSSTAGKRVRV
jgi:hypothetical protein